MKICPSCQINKNDEFFYIQKNRKDCLSYDCKECSKIRTKTRQSSIDGKTKLKEYHKSYYLDNKELIHTKNKKYYENNKEKVRLINDRLHRQKMQNNPFYKLKHQLRTRLYQALQKTFWLKKSNFNKYIGCSRDELLQHIELQFKPGMTWKNHGEWHIDHKTPLCSAKTEEELYGLCHYTNLQPLWAEENLKKNGKLCPS